MARRPYHHGSLTEALLSAGTEAARREGVSGIAVRELASEVGVSPSAVYRHFPSADHLLAMVSQGAREEAARRMIAARDAVTARRGAANAAVARFRAIGSAYVQFALDEPNLFLTAFAECSAEPTGEDDPSAWTVLTGSIDELVAAGVLPRSLAGDAPLIAWSSVHGLAHILLEDPRFAPGGRRQAIDSVLDGMMRALGMSVSAARR